MADGEEGPSPNVYNITTDIINTVTPRAPSYSFGVMHSGTQFISEAHEAIKFGEASPGPSAYDAEDPGKAPAFTFGGADRTEPKKFISHSHTKENFGMHSPGPAHAGSLPASSMGGAPAQPFGTGKRPGLHKRNTYEAGPGSHEINRGMGDNRHAQRNPPKYSFAKSAAKSKFHDSRVFNSHSSEFSRHRLGEATVGPQSPHALFGGDWDKSDEALVGVTGKMQSPRYSFTKSSRFTAGVQQQVNGEDGPPGPGSYIFREVSDLMGTGRSALTSTHTISSTSTLFGKEGRMRSSQKQPFISSAHARANLGVDGPGPARYNPKTTQTIASILGGAASTSARGGPFKEGSADNTPAPGLYSPTQAHTPRAATHIMGARNPELTQAETPGPDQYTPRQEGTFSSARGRRGTQVMQNKAPRTEQTRFISSWHAQSELQGQDQNPGPKYENPSTLGPKNAPAFGFGSSKAHDAGGQVFISATHSKENKGIAGPGPGAYSPRMPTTPRGTGFSSRFGTASQRVASRGGDKPGPGAYTDAKLSPRVARTAPSCTFGGAKTFRLKSDGRSRERNYVA